MNPKNTENIFWSKENREYYSRPREHYNFLYYVFSDNDFCNSLMQAVKALHKKIRPKALYLYNQNKIINFLHRDMVNSSVLNTYFWGGDTQSFHKEKFEQKALHYEKYIDNDIQVYYLNKSEELYKVDDPNGHAVLYCINTDSYWSV